MPAKRKATKGFRFQIASIDDAAIVYDALSDFLLKFRSMDREAAVEFRRIVAANRLSQHGPLGLAVARVLVDFSPRDPLAQDAKAK